MIVGIHECHVVTEFLLRFLMIICRAERPPPPHWESISPHISYYEEKVGAHESDAYRPGPKNQIVGAHSQLFLSDLPTFDPYPTLGCIQLLSICKQWWTSLIDHIFGSWCLVVEVAVYLIWVSTNYNLVPSASHDLSAPLASLDKSLIRIDTRYAREILQ